MLVLVVWVGLSLIGLGDIVVRSEWPSQQAGKLSSEIFAPGWTILGNISTELAVCDPTSMGQNVIRRRCRAFPFRGDLSVGDDAYLGVKEVSDRVFSRSDTAAPREHRSEKTDYFH